MLIFRSIAPDRPDPLRPTINPNFHMLPFPLNLQISRVGAKAITSKLTEKKHIQTACNGCLCQGNGASTKEKVVGAQPPPSCSFARH